MSLAPSDPGLLQSYILNILRETFLKVWEPREGSRQLRGIPCSGTPSQPGTQAPEAGLGLGAGLAGEVSAQAFLLGALPTGLLPDLTPSFSVHSHCPTTKSMPLAQGLAPHISITVLLVPVHLTLSAPSGPLSKLPLCSDVRCNV